MNDSILSRTLIEIGEHGSIRINPKGELSVFDLIRVVGGKKDSHKDWKRLWDNFPEVTTK